MEFARGSDVVQEAAAWGAAGLSVGCFVWDGFTPGGGFPGRVAIGFAVVAASFYVGVKQSRATRSATRELTACVDKTIGMSVEFGRRQAERRRLDDQAVGDNVRPFAPRGKGGRKS